MKKWKKIKKSWLVAGATGILIIGAGIAVLVNASGLHTIFEPKDYKDFENQYENSMNYDSAAGDGEESDLADENEDGENVGGEDTQKALKVAQEEPRDLDDTDALGLADEQDYADDPGQRRNPNAFELSDDPGLGGIDVKPNGEDNGNGQGSGGNPGNGGGGGTPTETGAPSASGVPDPTNIPGPTQEPGPTDRPEPTSRPDPIETPEPTGRPDPTQIPTPTQKPDPTNIPTPTQGPGTWEDDQLKPRDPVETKDGKLVGLSVVIHKEYYYRGDVFQGSDAQVTGTFLQSDGTRKRKEISYGGENGYRVVMSTKMVGAQTATFTYLNRTATANYTVVSSGVSVRYHGADANGGIFAIVYPGPLGGDEETMDELSQRDFLPTSGGIVDLTDIHRRMAAYLGDAQIQEDFLKDISYRNVVFLEEADGYLTNMLCGFQYYSNGNLEENGPYLYYPVPNWGANHLRNVVNVVKSVPEGYKIRRTTHNADNLKKYRADQTLEQYTGNEEVLSVPMGVTEIALKGKQGSGDIISLVLPESVSKIDFTSVTKCLPGLKAYEVSSRSAYQAVDGVLYSKDMTTLLSVPAGKTRIQIPDTVTTIASKAFENSSIRRLDIPETVNRLEERCFDGFRADVICMEGERIPKISGDTGYRGKVLFMDSDYDILMKEGMFVFQSEDIIFGAMDENGKEISEKTGIYQYDRERRILTLRGDAETLAGIPIDTYGRYAVSDGVTVIGSGAFAGIDGLREIDLPDTVRELGEESLVFSGGPKSVFLSGEKTDISHRALGDPADWAGNSNITVYVPEEFYDGYLKQWSQTLDLVYGEGTAAELLRPNDAELLYENQAIYRKIRNNGQTSYQLLKVYAPDKTAFQVKEGTTVIEAGALASCEALEILWLPDELRDVEDGAFSGCVNLQTVTVKAAEILSGDVFDSQGSNVRIYEKGAEYSEFIYDEGAVYGKNQKGAYTLIDVPTDWNSEFALYENTARLGAAAFRDCEITKLHIPDPVALEEIGDRCFENCASIRSIRLDELVHLEKIGQEAFRSCVNLETLYLPDHLRKVQRGLCYDCTSLQMVKAAGIRQAPDEMFYNCQSLLSSGLTLDWQRITTVGDRAFAYCGLLTEMPDMPRLESLGEQAFFTCQRLKRIVLPETLSSMGEECFGECSSLTQAVMNGKLTGISRYCFYGCRSLMRVEFSRRQKDVLQVVGVQAFGRCASLESLDLSGFSALRQMGERTFAGCDFLTSVRLPESLAKVPDYCFEECPNLSILALFADEVVELGQAVFGEDLSPFINLWVKEERLTEYRKAYLDVLDGTYGQGTAERILGKIDEKKEIIRGITFEITDEGRVLKEASEAFEGNYTVPIHTIRIESEAFLNCMKLTGIVLPEDSSISLGDRCFYGCGALKTVELYGDIPQWGEETFMNCAALEKVDLGGNRLHTIQRVGTRAFKGCTGLVGRQSVTARASIFELGEECFADCVNLEAIPTSEYARVNLASVGERAFAGCVNLTQFLTSAFSGLETVGAYAFANCDSLVNPSIPAGVTSVGEGAFSECDNLATVSFYCVLEEYPKDCFKNSPKLTRTGGVSAALAGLRRIGEGAYEGCVSLTTNASWNLGRYPGLEEIGDGAFKGCSNMTSVQLSPVMKRIGAGAFDGCVGVEQMVFESSVPPEMGQIALDTLSPDFCIRVPDSQSEGDFIYKEYRAVFTEMFGSQRAYEILDSVSDGAKDRNGQSPLAGEMQLEQTPSENAASQLLAPEETQEDVAQSDGMESDQEKGDEIGNSEIEEAKE